MIIHNIKYFILVDFDYEKDLIRDQDLKNDEEKQRMEKTSIAIFLIIQTRY